MRRRDRDARMGGRGGRRYDGPVRRYLTRRCMGLHLMLLVLLPTFAWLTSWQLSRAEGGNTLSWAYTFLWPLFGVYAIYTWWQLIHDQQTIRPRRADPGHLSTGATAADRTQPADPRPPGWALTGGRRRNVAIAARAPIDDETGGRGERYAPQTPEEAARLAEYNRYLSELDAADSRARG